MINQMYVEYMVPQAAEAFSRQAVPDLNGTLLSPNPKANAMSGLASSLKGAVLLGHSESGDVPLDAAPWVDENAKVKFALYRVDRAASM